MRFALIYSGIAGNNGADYMMYQFANAITRSYEHSCFYLGQFAERVWFKRDIARLAQTPDVFLSIGGRNLTASNVKMMQKIAPVVVWTQNDELRGWRHVIRRISKRVDIHYSYTQRAVRMYGNHVKYMPIAADEYTYYPQPYREYRDTDRLIDVAMIGCGHWWRQKFIARLSGKFQKTFFDMSLDLATSDVNNIYNQAKVIIAPMQHCDGRRPGRAWGCPCRTFEVPATWGFQLNVKRGGLEDVFPLHAAIECDIRPERAADEWAEGINRCLKDFDYRKYIADSQYEHWWKNHRYRHRLETMVADLKALSDVSDSDDTPH